MALTDQQFLSAYLRRIEYDGKPTPDLQTLMRLQYRHISAIPFENLDLLKDYTPCLDLERLYEKVIVQRRGGVCFELSYLFLHLLRIIGFSAVQICASVRQQGCMNEHPLILVSLPDGEYIADVGFVDAALPVLPLKFDTVTAAYDQQFRLVSEEQYIQLQRLNGTVFERLYTFSTAPMEVKDYMEQFRWAATPGNTVFSTYPICSRLLPDGHVFFVRDTLHVRRNGAVTSQRLTAEDQIQECLKTYFLPS